MKTAPLALLCGCLATGLGLSPLPAEEGESTVVEAEVAAVGMDYLSQAPVVLVREKEGGKFLPIWIGIAEARAIVSALYGFEPPRPMTHDLLRDLLQASGTGVEKIVIHDLREGTYFSSIHGLRQSEGETFIIDSRPSDALALALRTGALIEVESRLLENIPQYQFSPGGPGEGAVRLLGAVVVELTARLRRELNLDPELEGVLVAEVDAETQTPLEIGDIILEVDGNKIRNPMDFLEAVKALNFGERVRIKVWRKGEIEEWEVPHLPDLKGDPVRI